MKNWLTHHKRSLSLISIALITGLLTWILWPAPAVVQQSAKPTSMPAYTVKQTQITTFFKAPGTIIPKVESKLMAQVVANVTHIYVDAGEKVHQGQQLIQLDDRDQTAKVEQAKQQVNARRALLTNNQLTFNRMKKLVKDGHVSKAEFDTAQANYLQAEANLIQSQKALHAAQVALSYCQIKAPSNGIILKKYVNVGDQTFPLKPLLGFQAQGALRIDADIPESLASKVMLNDTLTVSIDSTHMKVNGIVSEIVPSVDPSSRSFVIKVTLPNTPGIYTGMFGQVWIPVGKEATTVIPKNYIQQNGQLAMVYVQDTQGVSRVAVTTGKTLPDNMVEILSGLNPGDDIVEPSAFKNE